MGGLFALVFTVAYGRLGLRTAGDGGPLGCSAFVGLCVVPWLKYPPNPPAVGQEDTIGKRTGLYVTMLLLSVAAIVVAVVVRRRLVPRFGGWNATLVVGAGYLVTMVSASCCCPASTRCPNSASRASSTPSPTPG